MSADDRRWMPPTSDRSGEPDEPGGGEDAVAMMARQVGRELRQDAPADGLAHLERRRRSQVRTRNLVGGSLTILLATALALQLRREPQPSGVAPPSTTATTAITTTSTTSIAPIDELTVDDTGRAAGASDPTPDTARDQAIAETARVTAAQLGVEWSPAPTAPAPSAGELEARLAAEPLCRAYVGRSAAVPIPAEVTDGYTNVRSQFLFHDVSIYPTVAAATQAMDLLADPGWIRCTNQLNDAAAMRSNPGGSQRTIGVRVPPPAAHGDRRISYGLETLANQPGYQPASTTVLMVAVQVGRGVVIVSPAPDLDDPSTPRSSVDLIVRLATDALDRALAG